jgi:adenylate kinase
VIVVLLGPPGVGKGTHGRIVALRHGLRAVSTGEMLRAEMAVGTPLGNRARTYIDQGNLVPDDIMLALIERLLKRGPAGNYLLDGFPRTVAQAEGLEKILAPLGQRVDAVLFLSVGEEVLVKRLSERRICPVDGRVYNLTSQPPRVPGRCDEHPDAELAIRTDDQPETVRRRFQVYRAETAPLIDYYRGRGLLKEVDADGSVDEVAARVEATFG